MPIVKNLFLTGPKHVGKTTILDGAVAHAVGCASARASCPVGGFRVEREYDGRRLRAFRIVDVASGKSAPIASARKGGWDVNAVGFETVGAEAVADAARSARLIVMDELGRFELAAPGFQAAVMKALSSPVPVLGVLKADSNPFLDAIRARDDTTILEVTEANRDGVMLRVQDWLASVLQLGDDR